MRRLLTRLVFAATLFAAPVPAFANVTEADATAWIDAQLAAVRAAGATEASRGAVTADPATGAVTIVDITFGTTGTEGWRAKIERIEVAGAAAGGARFAAREIVASKLSLTGRYGEAKLDRVMLAGTDMPAIAGTGTPVMTWLGEALGTAKLQTLRFEALTINGGVGAEKFMLSQPTIVFTGLIDGVVGSSAFSPASGSVGASPAETLTFEVGEQAYERFDVALYGSIFGVGPRKPTNELLPLYTTSRVAGFNVRLANIFALTMGPIESGAMRMKVPATSIQQLLDVTQRLEAAGDDPPPELAKEAAKALRDWINPYAIASISARNLKVVAEDTGVTMDRMTMTGMTAIALKDMRIAGIAIETPQGRGKLDAFEMQDLDFGPLLEATLKTLEEGSMADPDVSVFGSAIPRLGRLSLLGLSVEVPGMPIGPVSLQDFTFRMGTWRDFMVDKLSISMKGLDLPGALAALVPPYNLGGLGYERIVIDAETGLSMDPDKGNTLIGPTRFAIKDAVATSFDVRLTGITSDLVLQLGVLQSLDGETESIGFEALEFRVEDKGLMDRVVNMTAQQTGQPPAAARRALAQQFAESARTIRNQDLRNRVRNAITAYVNGAKTFTFTVKGRNATLADFEALTGAQTPEALRKFDIQVNAR